MNEHMNEHYFTEDPHSAHAERQIELNALGLDLRFLTDAGTFSRDGLDRGTEVLLNALPPLSGRVLDLGCGWGAVGVTLAKRYPDLAVTMTDINARAVELARRNATANGVSAHVVQGDGYARVDGCFDAIITNPPIRAGKAVIYALFDDARAHLLPDGALYIVIRKQQGAPSALRHLQTVYPDVTVLDRASGFWVLRASCASPL